MVSARVARGGEADPFLNYISYYIKWGLLQNHRVTSITFDFLFVQLTLASTVLFRSLFSYKLPLCSQVCFSSLSSCTTVVDATQGGHSTFFFFFGGYVPRGFPKVGYRELAFLEKMGVLEAKIQKFCILRAEILAKNKAENANFF